MITNVCFTVMLRDKTIIRRRLRTPPRKMFTAEGLEHLLADEAGRVEQFFPGREFRLVPLRGGKHFNFVEEPKDLQHLEDHGAQASADLPGM